MFIHEAVKEASKRKTNIRRRFWDPCGVQFWLTTPVTIHKIGKGPAHWMPTPEDLMADDWEVVE